MPATRPRPELPVKQVTTRVLRVPRVDWAAITAGTKTQFRAIGRTAADFANCALPRPVVLYSLHSYRVHREADARVAVLTDFHREPLGAITPEGLAAEGFSDLAHFRRYWSTRHSHAGFRPLTIVSVYTLRPWQDDDRARFADILIDHLYGPWLP